MPGGCHKIGIAFYPTYALSVVEGFFEYGGARLFYKKFGRGEPVLIVHGMMSNHTHTEGFGRMLARAGFSPILIDLPFHGKSEGAILTIGGLLKAVEGLVHNMGIEEYHCIGHSLGSLICSSLARLDPYARSLCAIAPVVSDIRPAEFTFKAYLGNILEGDFSHKGLVRRLCEESVSPGVSQEEVDRIFTKHTRTSHATAIHDIILALQINCGTNLRYLRKPLMVIAGRHDPLAPPDEVKKFLPEHAKFVVLNKGHVDMKPEDLIVRGKNVLVEFLKSAR